MHACIHTERQTDIQTDRHTHTYIHTYIRTYVRTYIQLHYITLHYITLHYRHTHIHTSTHTYIQTDRHTYIRTYVRTYIHMNPIFLELVIHTNVSTYTGKDGQPLPKQLGLSRYFESRGPEISWTFSVFWPSNFLGQWFGGLIQWGKSERSLRRAWEDDHLLDLGGFPQVSDTSIIPIRFKSKPSCSS